MTITMVVADDHPLVLEGLENLLRATPDIRILSRCVNGDEALEATRRHRPELLLVDLNMPRRSGLEVLRAVQEDALGTRVVLLVAELTRSEAHEAVRLGVGGILLKELAPNLLISVLRRVHAGEQWIEKRTLDGLVGELLTRDAGLRQASTVLTPRELELVRLVASGLRNRAIAERLGVTEGTVKLHLHNIYTKLRIESRVQLTVYAQRKGLTEG